MPVTFECPGCGTRTTFDRLRQSAEEFCRQCDYPLFWATPLTADEPDALAQVGNGLDPAILRRPGVAGRVATLGATCPTCGEMNSLTADFCIRCGSPMHPEPPPPEPLPVPPPPLPEPVEPVRNRTIWPFVVAGVLVLLVIIAVLVAVL